VSVWGLLTRIVPERVRESYLLKLAIAFGLVLTATGLAGAYVYAETDRQLDREVRTDLETSAADEATTVENWVRERERLARMLSEYEPMSRDTSESTSLFLQRELRNLPEDVFRVHVVDGPTRSVYATSAPLLTDENVTESAPWGDVSFGFSQNDDAVYRSQVYRSDGVSVVAFVTPVPNRASRFLVVTADVAAVTADFDNPADGSFTQVVDGGGTVLVDELGREVLDPYVDNGTAPIVRAGANGTPSFRESARSEKSLSENYVVASHPIDGTDWTVVVHTPTSAAYELRRTVTVNLAALLVVAFVGLGVVALTIGRNTVLALDELSEKARSLESGDLSVELNSDRRDEVGDVFGAFAAMRDSLRDRIEELSTAKREAERTREELATTNRDLEEQRVIISVLNRLLTHNLRNSMTLVLGHARRLANELSGDTAESAETIHRTTEVTLRRIEKSKRVERVINSEVVDVDPTDVTDVVDALAEKFCTQYPEASVETDLPDEAVALADDSLGFVVDNLVENAIEHNDTADPSVWISVGRTEDDEYVTVRIADDGPGIPDMETDVLEQDQETKLRHGSGMGLWIVNWLAENLGGFLEFEDRDPRGTVAVVYLRTGER
jgi:methyl-accepting chemotaxis protein